MRIYLCAGNSCEQNIFDQIETTNQIIVISMLQNYSHMYSNHNSIIKIVSFKSIYYVINRGGARILIRPGLKLKSNKKLFKKIKYNKIAYTKSFEQIFIKIYHVQH